MQISRSAETTGLTWIFFTREGPSRREMGHSGTTWKRHPLYYSVHKYSTAELSLQHFSAMLNSCYPPKLNKDMTGMYAMCVRALPGWQQPFKRREALVESLPVLVRGCSVSQLLGRPSQPQRMQIILLLSLWPLLRLDCHISKGVSGNGYMP